MFCRREAVTSGGAKVPSVSAPRFSRKTPAVATSVWPSGGDFAAAFQLYESKRVVRTARVVLSAREMGRIYHARGIERQVRNSLWQGRTPERFYDAMEWLYGWRVDHCMD